MEVNELEKAARDYAKKEWKYWTWSEQCEECAKDFTAGANWKTERENAELTRTSKELDAMTTKYNELSRKYDDLYRKHKPS